MTDKYAHFHLKNMHIYLGKETKKKILGRNKMDTENVKLLKTHEEKINDKIKALVLENV